MSFNGDLQGAARSSLPKPGSHARAIPISGPIRSRNSVPISPPSPHASTRSTRRWGGVRRRSYCLPIHQLTLWCFNYHSRRRAPSETRVPTITPSTCWVARACPQHRPGPVNWHQSTVRTWRKELRCPTAPSSFGARGFGPMNAWYI